jgi:uncharacterized membrane protein
MLRTVLRWLLAVGFVLAGLNHFRDPAFYLAIMPPALPWHRFLVDASGVLEVLGGLGVLLPATRRLAGWGLIALLIAVFPANLYSAESHAAIPTLRAVPPVLLWVRLPFQAVFIAWAYYAAASPSAQRARAASY